jgi:hypothetical protein
LIGAALLVSTAAHAEIALMSPGMPWNPSHPISAEDLQPRKVGDIVEVRQRQIFYVNRKCKLPIVNAESMREYTYDPSFGSPAPLTVGCWGLTVNGDAVTVAPNQKSTSVAAQALWKVDVRSDGTARIMRLHGLKEDPQP